MTFGYILNFKKQMLQDIICYNIMMKPIGSVLNVPQINEKKLRFFTKPKKKLTYEGKLMTQLNDAMNSSDLSNPTTYYMQY